MNVSNEQTNTQKMLQYNQGKERIVQSGLDRKLVTVTDGNIDIRESSILNCRDYSSDLLLSLLSPASTVSVASDADAQLIIKLKFTEKVDCTQIQFFPSELPSDPSISPARLVKLFTNANDMDFSDVENMTPNLQVELPFEYAGNAPFVVSLGGTKFSRISSLQIFIQDNFDTDYSTLGPVRVDGFIAPSYHTNDPHSMSVTASSVDLLTFIARASDGLILSETWDSGQSDALAVYKQQAKKILTKLKNAPARCSVDGGTAASPILFHYVVDNGICYLALAGKSFPKRLAFAFLEDIHRAFIEELKRHYGTGSVDYWSQIETIRKPYFFITFDRTVQKKRAEYRDPNSSSAIAKLNEGLAEVNTIVRKSLEDMIARGDALDDVSGRANTLRDEAKRFEKSAKYLNWQAMVRKYGILAAITFAILLIIWFKFFF